MIQLEPAWYRLTCDDCNRVGPMERSSERIRDLLPRLGWECLPVTEEKITRHRCDQCIKARRLADETKKEGEKNANTTAGKT